MKELPFRSAYLPYPQGSPFEVEPVNRRQSLVILGTGVLLARDPPPPQPWVRVRLFSHIPQLDQVILTAPLTLAGKTVAHGSWRLRAEEGSLWVESLTHDHSPRRYGQSLFVEQAQGIQVQVQSPARRYRGRLEISITAANQLAIHNYLPLEAYLYGVVPSEMPPEWPTAALEAQAIVARTHALSHHQQGDPTPLLDSTAQQFYGGLTYERPTTTRAVQATSGQLLTFSSHPQPIQALYHSTCGGHTSANQTIFAPPARPYLQGIPCEWCQPSPFYGPHTIHLAQADIQRIFGEREVHVLEQDPHGRPTQIAVGSRRLTGQAFWLQLGQDLGWGVLPSNRYDWQPVEQGYRVTYRGAGHGVGLCQWGAYGQAQAGRSAAQILSSYYPQTHLGSLPF
ncbi:MAG: SpoIID/LytB domain-containing protein [Cyanobacteriota bacterium]|nr:SpoIID/LytB domain-containing protein [Cyanobacteriota bacterium]